MKYIDVKSECLADHMFRDLGGLMGATIRVTGRAQGSSGDTCL